MVVVEIEINQHYPNEYDSKLFRSNTTTEEIVDFVKNNAKATTVWFKGYIYGREQFLEVYS